MVAAAMAMIMKKITFPPTFLFFFHSSSLFFFFNLGSVEVVIAVIAV